LRVSAKNAKKTARPWGFTLVELLTVIAIIAVLATLVSASLGNAQRKGRKAVSTSNLRQIALAFNLYVDDRDKRPESFRQLTANKYLSERVLICPEDRLVKNWAGELESQDLWLREGNAVGVTVPNSDSPAASPGGGRATEDVPHSYFKSFDYLKEIWTEIEKSAMGGVAACQLHGIGRQRKEETPSITAYQGLVLRALKDGSVVNRQVFWNGRGVFNNMGDSNAPAVNFGNSSQLPLFLDPTE
jgi:prepilin-type N-terminal cleavage/methylation domain-containing protein